MLLPGRNQCEVRACELFLNRAFLESHSCIIAPAAAVLRRHKHENQAGHHHGGFRRSNGGQRAAAGFGHLSDVLRGPRQVCCVCFGSSESREHIYSKREKRKTRDKFKFVAIDIFAVSPPIVSRRRFSLNSSPLTHLDPRVVGVPIWQQLQRCRSPPPPCMSACVQRH